MKSSAINDHGQQACVATADDLKAMRRQCWRPGCKRRAFIRDWKGWKWCLCDWWRQFEYKNLQNLCIELRNMRLF